MPRPAPPALSLDDVPGGPAPGSVIAPAAAVGEGTALRLRLSDPDGGEFDAFLIRHQGRIIGFHNSCPHQSLPLVEEDGALIDGTRLVCRHHQAYFDLQTGRCVAGPCRHRYLRRIAVSECDGDIVAL